MITDKPRNELIEEFARTKGDTGSPEVQVALLTQRIRHLTGHLIANKRDHSTRRGLLKLVGQRSKLLRYLAGRDVGRYQTLIQRLGLRK
ncbi:MAG: 30S ribosomal protein S15 [Planctomycetota bacterium]